MAASESKELVQGTLDEVLANEGTGELIDPLGEKPIGRTPTGLPIYPTEPSDAELRRQLSQQYYAKKAQATKAEERLRAAAERSRVRRAARGHTQAADQTMRLRMGKGWGRGNR